MAKIVVEKINKTFNKGSKNANHVLKDVSFSLPEKGFVCIFGKSGSGKTTLLNIIGGLDKQDSGKVFIDGVCTTGNSDKIRNEKIGFIFQNYYLERGYTIAEILRNAMLIAGFRDEKEIKKRTEEALKLVDMQRFKNKRGDALSGGQQQRVAIARALVKGGDIILADEPTGNLDAENTLKVMDILKEISKTRLVVVVTHEVTLIKRYADSHIRIVDGELVKEGEIEEAELASITYEGVEHQSQTASADISSFTKSQATRNGRLFNFKNICKSIKNGGEEKVYSTGNLFKLVFILIMAVLVAFFALFSYESARATVEEKTLSDTDFYAELNTYSDLKRIDQSLYEQIDFFETHYREGSFSYNNLASLTGISASYILTAMPSDDLRLEYGNLPEEGEVLISRALAEELKSQLRLSELNNDECLGFLKFDGEYPISGIVADSEKRVYMLKVDYVNYLGVYNSLQLHTTFYDGVPVFFDESFVTAEGITHASFSCEISVADEEEELADNQIILEINRNSLYNMISDTGKADVKLREANKMLTKAPSAVYIVGSKPMYVKKFVITRSAMTTDIRVHVNGNVIQNILVYIAPGLDEISGSNGSDYFFDISTKDAQQMQSLTEYLNGRDIDSANIASVYESEKKELYEAAATTYGVFALACLLMYLVYYFIEKSAGVKNSKEYGVYRAVGVNKSNLLYKEFVLTLLNNIVPFLIFGIVTVAIMCVRYSVMNVAVGAFVGICLGYFALAALLMIGVSLVPYLFVLFKTPSQILASYDI